MATGKLRISTVAKRLISATTAKRLISTTTAKGMAMVVKVGRFIKEIALVENPAFTDSPAFTVNKVLSDSANFAGEPSLVPATSLSNSGGFTDAPVFTVGKGLTDSSGFSDSGVILAQDYCGPDYFSGDYTGTQTTF